MKRYNTVIVGNSITNLICSALLANSGQKIMYIRIKNKDRGVGYFPERNGEFPICEYSFDCESGIFHELLQELKLGEKIHCEKELPYLGYILNDEKLSCEYSWDGFKQLIIARFREEQEAIRNFFSLIEKLSDEWIYMVNSSEFPKLEKIMNMAKYSHVKYVDHIHKTFNDISLIKILEQEVVSKDVSLPVMAGYIMQLFNGKRIEGGYKELENHLYSIVYKSSYVIEAEEADVKYEYYSEEKCFNVSIDENNYLSDTLVLNTDFLGMFVPKKEDVSKHHIFYINCLIDKKSSPNGNIYKYCGGLIGGDNDKSDYYCVISESEDKVQARVFISDAKNIDVDLVVEDVIMQVTNLCGVVISYDIVDESEINQYFQWHNGQINEWSFSPTDFKENPLTKKYSPSGLYLTNTWGRAFITSAKITAKNIIMSSKEFN
ncbi:hypothetical protein CSC2_13980 [Clostridium zeae]|uniref:Uncharacterized protein n=1 Tax=Clostridium zeae TaxID=2759022 RepID=A0ABQ1E7W3_9CLOT|nr:hypothetical protein [Clostridium zeae]GFZ30872.1 hypothetical protein CSC2_13980 [Clostridium zeae]